MDKGLIYLFILLLYLLATVPLTRKLKSLSKKHTPSKYTQPELFEINIGIEDVIVKDKTYEDYDIANVPNDQFVYNYDYDIDATNFINEIKGQACQPTTFGYTIEEAKQVFPEFDYPSCISQIDSEIPNIYLDYYNNTATIMCKNNQPQVLIEPNFIKNRFYHHQEAASYWQVKYKSQVKLKGQEEYIFAGCQDDKFTEVQYLPRYNKTAHIQTSQLFQKQQNKPMIVLNIVCDSYSRRHFYRMLPKTIKYLNQINNQTSYQSYDMKLHNIMGATSVTNMIPMLGKKKFNEEMVKNGQKITLDGDLLGASALWQKFKKYGFITYLGIEACDPGFIKALGRFPQVDYLTRTFYCAAEKFLDYRSNKYFTNKRRCIGKQMSHWYMMNYALEIIKMYSDVNFWGHMHINTAHEATGLHAMTLDDDLVWFLKILMEDIGQKAEIAIILQADHGMRYGNYYSDNRAYQENKLPACFLIFSKSILDRIPFSYDNLEWNSWRLNSKRDLRATQLSLLSQLGGRKYDIYEEDFLHDSYSLLEHKIPKSRICSDAGIKGTRCSCLNLYEMDSKYYNSDLIITIVSLAIEEINRKALMSALNNYHICQKVVSFNVLRAYYQQIDSIQEQYQVLFSVNQLQDVKFEVFSRLDLVTKADREKPFLHNFVYKGYKTKIILLGVERRSSYAGSCEAYLREFSINPEFCIC